MREGGGLGAQQVSYHQPKLMWGSNLVTSSKLLTSHKVMILKMDQAFFCKMTTHASIEGTNLVTSSKFLTGKGADVLHLS